MEADLLVLQGYEGDGKASSNPQQDWYPAWLLGWEEAMKLIKISVYPAADGEVVSGTVVKQRLRNGTWIVEETLPFISDTPEAERTLLLDDSQRIVIEGTSNVKVVYDPTQAAAVPQRQPVSRPRPLADIGDDGYESPSVPLSEIARSGEGLLSAMAQERRDRLITEARRMIKEKAKESVKEAAKG